jgi:hypothetical protein
VRASAVLALVLAVSAAGCSGQRRDGKDAALAPLTPCESREISFDGADVLLTSNADSTLASVHVRDSNEAVRRDVLKDVYRTFGSIHIDTDVVARTSKWGLTTWADRCGRPITFTVPKQTPPR